MEMVSIEPQEYGENEGNEEGITERCQAASSRISRRGEVSSHRKGIRVSSCRQSIVESAQGAAVSEWCVDIGILAAVVNLEFLWYLIFLYKF